MGRWGMLMRDVLLLGKILFLGGLVSFAGV